jgi:SAM-dependent methyltransferase
MNTAQPVADEYRSLGPLQTRILTHQRYSERPNDPDLDVRRALRLSPEGELLDVGCGTGEFLRRLRADGHTGRLCAIDASQAAVDAAGAVQGVEARLGDAQALPYPDAGFDAVTARHMLYHVPDPVRAIRQARRVLRKGGRFAAVVNIERPMPLINATVDAVLAAHGIAGDTPADAAVHAGNLPGMVESAFGAGEGEGNGEGNGAGEIEVVRVENALVFHDAEPVLRYCLSMLTLSGVPQDGPVREAIEADLAGAVRERFAATGGVWRDPKGYVVCTAVHA